MFNRSLLSLVYLLAIFSLFATNVYAVDLGYGIKTGMSYDQVAKKIELEHFKNQKGLDAYHRLDSGSYYFFSDQNEKLIYKLSFQPNDKWDSTMKVLKDLCGDYTKARDHYFFSNGDSGFKMFKLEAQEGYWQLWFGSVSLWNKHARKYSMNPFPK